MHLLISFFVTDFVRMMETRPVLAIEPFIPFNVQKLDFPPYMALSSINDDFKRGCVTGDHSFIGFSTRRPWFKSCPNLIFLPCIYSFLSLLRTVRKNCMFFFFSFIRKIADFVDHVWDRTKRGHARGWSAGCRSGRICGVSHGLHGIFTTISKLRFLIFERFLDIGLH